MQRHTYSVISFQANFTSLKDVLKNMLWAPNKHNRRSKLERRQCLNWTLFLANWFDEVYIIIIIAGENLERDTIVQRDGVCLLIKYTVCKICF